jgi:phosphate transport system substrate-binding protein
VPDNNPSGSQPSPEQALRFPYPLYSKWVAVYEGKTGVRINDQSFGSGTGIRQVIQGTVDFGASDVPMSDEELAGCGRRRVQSTAGCTSHESTPHKSLRLAVA